MMFRTHPVALLALTLLPSCEEPTDWQFQPLENGALVVEAIITNELKNQEILLSLSYDDLNGQPAPATGAELRVAGGGETYLFQEVPGQPGRYLSEEAFAAKLVINYTLDIQWNGGNYLATNRMVPVYPMKRLDFLPYGATDSLVIGEVAPIYLPYEQAMYEIDIDWTHLVNSDSARAKMFFYTFRTLDVNELFRPPRETVVFPKGSIVIERKHSLNPDFAAFQRALAMETEWQGGVFDEASSSLPTNISNGGHGFFGVCAVISDTLIAE
ncbi:MAG: DUF4249 family protein [Saprospirales bacterium]|nr:DUF4249 family protein [Saprospirales bacterium]